MSTNININDFNLKSLRKTRIHESLYPKIIELSQQGITSTNILKSISLYVKGSKETHDLNNLVWQFQKDNQERGLYFERRAGSSNATTQPVIVAKPTEFSERAKLAFSILELNPDSQKDCEFILEHMNNNKMIGLALLNFTSCDMEVLKERAIDKREKAQNSTLSQVRQLLSLCFCSIIKDCDESCDMLKDSVLHAIRLAK